MPIQQRYVGPACDADTYWMQRALNTAARAVGATSPNPPVGAVLVRDGVMLASGFTRPPGQAHAEAAAFQALTSPALAKGATLYVTLEPCSSHGRTPPCTDAILDHQIARVVYGSTDPNPKHAGRAKQLLESAGVAVSTGVLQQECDHLSRIFRHWIRFNRPYIIAKAGLSLDGRLNRPEGESSWLTSLASRRDAQRLRIEVDAILVGAATIRQDDPQLTIRHSNVPKAKQALKRIVLTQSGNLPTDAKVFTGALAEHTLTFKHVAWPELLDQLSERGITSVLIEGGGNILTSALEAQCVQEAHLYIAPIISGGDVSMIQHALSHSIQFHQPSYQQIGDDLRVSGTLTYAS